MLIFGTRPEAIKVFPVVHAIAQVIIAVEGPIAITECASGQDNCSLSKDCHLKDNWSVLNNFFIDTLNNISIADMSRAISEQPIQFTLELNS